MSVPGARCRSALGVGFVVMTKFAARSCAVRGRRGGAASPRPRRRLRSATAYRGRPDCEEDRWRGRTTDLPPRGGRVGRAVTAGERRPLSCACPGSSAYPPWPGRWKQGTWPLSVWRPTAETAARWANAHDNGPARDGFGRGALLCDPLCTTAQSLAEHATHNGHRADGHGLGRAEIAGDRDDRRGGDTNRDDHHACERGEAERHILVPVGHDGTRCHQPENRSAEQQPAGNAANDPAEYAGAG
jgi:hypothetical protein